MTNPVISEIPLDSVGFSLILWTGLFFGILHTIIPCNEKFVFCFYAFGVARDWKQAFRIVNFYGAGLMLMNLLIGGSVSYIGAVVSSFFDVHENFRFVWNGISGFVLILSGTIMFIQLKRKKYWPHSDQFQELTENLGTLKTRKRTSFLLGMLAGIPPCLFEMAIYGWAITFSASYGWGNGTWTVFFYGIGTWLGLYPLALLVSAGGKLSKSLKGSTIQRLQEKIGLRKTEISSVEYIEGSNGLNSANKTVSSIKKAGKSRYSRIELLSAWALIFLGVVFLILAIFGIDILPTEIMPTGAPWPFPN
ncbi:MAG: urease accessory protein UreH domain-containing protein [Promethearchaeota archaeon]